MMTYVEWVKNYPLCSAAIQFGILGTVGELISFWIKTKSIQFPFSILKLFLKILSWAILGILIKYGFVAMRGAVDALLEHQMLPSMFQMGIWNALIVSVITNIFFGPQMMWFHRIEDNLIEKQWNMSGIEKAWMTLIWFWIPAHTITFSLPKEYQIGLAALWSIVLGIILGLSNLTTQKRVQE
ncbi:MAG: hypothetical protein N2450_07235 [bacterium]|nr:hypothetical protein [bacterium]